MRLYVDTSALLKTIVDEPESAAVAAELDRLDGDDLVASMLLHTEMYCAAARRAPTVPRYRISEILARFDLADVTRDDLVAAGRRTDRLRAADAIHLVTALRVEADAMLVYDAELSAAAADEGLRVLSPT